MTSSRSKGRTQARGPRIAFIQSAWHQDIVEQGFKGFVAEWKALGHEPSAIDAFLVPGAFEIPLHAQLLAKTGRYAGIVAAGFVVDGGIYRHDFVADAVIKALMQVQLETGIPVMSVVLTPHQFHAHAEHQKFFMEHFVVKGREAAVACHATVRSLEAIRNVAG
ncbi:MAG: 6,7-dimethyl-8-ribityllumazine synthase [Steroidobacteraceae bacterium]